jgi:hypothetical protein
VPIQGWSQVRRAALYDRCGGEVRVYGSVEPATRKPRRISRQFQGNHKKLNRKEARPKAQMIEGRHCGPRARSLAELVEWRRW